MSQAESVEKANYPGRWPANLILSHSEGCVEVGTRKVKTGTAVQRNGGRAIFGGIAGNPASPVDEECHLR